MINFFDGNPFIGYVEGGDQGLQAIALSLSNLL
jgi:hypothetical protein